MEKKKSKDSIDTKKLWAWVERSISLGFAAGVLALVALFAYVLFTQFLAE